MKKKKLLDKNRRVQKRQRSEKEKGKPVERGGGRCWLKYKERDRDKERERESKTRGHLKEETVLGKMQRKKKEKQKQYCVLLSTSRPQDFVETGGWADPGFLGLSWSREDGN